MKKEIKFTGELAELSSKLTAMQRKFVIYLVTSECSQRAAYLKAGGKSKTETAQDSAASTMLSNVKVRKFYEAMTAEAAQSAIMTRHEAMVILTKNANKAEECRDQHAAIKQLSDMEGWKAATKIDIGNQEGKALAIDTTINAPEVIQAMANIMDKL